MKFNFKIKYCNVISVIQDDYNLWYIKLNKNLRLQFCDFCEHYNETNTIINILDKI